MPSSTRPNKVPSTPYYNEYHGHTVPHLTQVHSTLRGPTGTRPLIFLAGDSTLDNKYWFSNTAPAIGGYESILSPPVMRKDVAYHLTLKSQSFPSTPAALNTAIEATTLSQRSCGRLLPQDRFLRDNLQPQDTLVVSCGGNDIALLPSPCTVLNMCLLLWLTPSWMVRSSVGFPVPLDDCCLGFGASCLSTLSTAPPPLGYFVHLFSVRLGAYVRALVARTKPRRVVVCTLYYLDEAPGSSWADGTLRALGYDRDPGKLQSVIKRIHEVAVSRIRIPGVDVVACPLFEAMDGKDTKDYVDRVEPSDQGGAKMADLILGYCGDDAQGGMKRE